MELITTCQTPLGSVTMACSQEGLTGLWFEGQKYFGLTLSPEYQTGDSPAFDQARQWLNIYFSGKKPDFLPPLAPKGTAFRLAVWKALTEIPYGSTVTYREIAEKIAVQKNVPSMSSQAVGQAVGHNPISIIIPCHRVVGSSGSLTGYAGGIEKKIRLLQLEHVDTSLFFIPRDNPKRKERST